MKEIYKYIGIFLIIISGIFLILILIDYFAWNKAFSGAKGSKPNESDPATIRKDPAPNERVIENSDSKSGNLINPDKEPIITQIDERLINPVINPNTGNDEKLLLVKSNEIARISNNGVTLDGELRTDSGNSEFTILKGNVPSTFRAVTYGEKKVIFGKEYYKVKNYNGTREPYYFYFPVSLVSNLI